MGRRKHKTQVDVADTVAGNADKIRPGRVRSLQDIGWRCGRPFRSEWRGLNGDKTLTDLAPDLKLLDFFAGIASGKYLTMNPPASWEHLNSVCPGLNP